MNRVLGVLISGRGSNLQAIIDAIDAGRLDARIGLVVSNRAGAQGLGRARMPGSTRSSSTTTRSRSREAFDLGGRGRAEAARRRSGLPGRVHAPAEPGVHPARSRRHPQHPPRAAARVPGARRPASGLETRREDFGRHRPPRHDGARRRPDLVQAAVPVLDDDTPETLAARTLVEEHRIYPEAIGIVLDGRWRIDGRRFVRLG